MCASVNNRVTTKPVDRLGSYSFNSLCTVNHILFQINTVMFNTVIILNIK